MKNIIYRSLFVGLIALMTLSACNNDQSYADRLNDERNSVNAYLANHRVCMTVPEDTVFEVGDKLTVFGDYATICRSFHAKEHFADD